ncbi:TIGR03364 family FAD-dependent oxidoreductase [Sediminibacterium soli]|uniref:TIGR03364 family FAD-dependent oxidoreductase n=1 Tax=Sediminibacterium soli TaxID=2698829 RepID=UPI00137B81C4|nr:TIGR03364 family FAD-dependent oxidoreductase [Sediminibacterium soli]NCI46289.1 TIGR03364 family FAD-dependent oxidoreductase [Sediminibacterium soli]
MKQKAIVIGAGIAGLATARSLAQRGYAVTVIERAGRASGASVRNFGMVWPVGQPAGELYDAARRSAEIWKEIGSGGTISCTPAGSLHVAYQADEWAVLQEVRERFHSEGRNVQLVAAETIAVKYPVIKTAGLIGGLYSAEELIVDPRQAIASLPVYLEEKYAVRFLWNRLVSDIRTGAVKLENEWLPADIVVVCGGQDFETLYPALYRALPITRCKLQMMRFAPVAEIGAAICGGLSLIHYASFAAAGSLETLRKRYQAELPDYLAAGIHVMVSQNTMGELTVGDSHEYAMEVDPFDKPSVNGLIMDYLCRFAHCETWKPIQQWHGVYPKLTNGAPYVFENPEENTFVLNGLGGAGMTLSFGLTEKLFASL